MLAQYRSNYIPKLNISRLKESKNLNLLKQKSNTRLKHPLSQQKGNKQLTKIDESAPSLIQGSHKALPAQRSKFKIKVEDLLE